jgi:hypothetical protein
MLLMIAQPVQPSPFMESITIPELPRQYIRLSCAAPVCLCLCSSEGQTGEGHVPAREEVPTSPGRGGKKQAAPAAAGMQKEQE